ncbi:hypothetical protein ACQP25_27195 [Microtetraspora malaysiensis]|uniref:hypothetical protein n=1 Tax=Microtetraspora malaysiensis TaxID=161358 RepID=UPI003D8AA897
MNRDWRNGSVELVDGYTITDGEGRAVGAMQGVRFAIEGGFVNIEVPGVTEVQIVSAPAVRRIVCHR